MANRRISQEKLKCKVEGCTNYQRYRKCGLCGKHYQRLMLGISERTIYDKNEIVIEHDCAKIFLYDSRGSKISEAIIDIEDVEKVSAYKWHLHSCGYVETCTRKYHFFLHRYIFNAIKGMHVDHINRNPLDNRKRNLRNAEHSENLCNAKVRSNNSSGYRGVVYSNRNKPWVAQIGKNGKFHYLGNFHTKQEAAIAYNEGALKYHGEFASLNIIEG